MPMHFITMLNNLTLLGFLPLFSIFAGNYDRYESDTEGEDQESHKKGSA